MSDFSMTELRRLDLTLLLVFLGLLRHRKALDVAGDLGLTHSAISQSLRRLRDIFGDELFLRRPHGLEPTSTALALEAPVAAAVEALRGALGAVRAFDPAKAQGAIRVAALDAEQAVLIPALSARLRDLAPGLTLSVLPLGRAAAIEAVTDGRADLALGFIWDTPDMIRSARIYEETFLVAAHPKLLPNAPSVSLDDYCAAQHVLISPAGDMRGVVDTQLQAMGRSRHVILGLPAFLPALAAVTTSQAMVTLPARLARAFAHGFGLVTAQPPLPLRSFPVSIFWHKRNQQDPKITWIRDQIHAVAQGL